MAKEKNSINDSKDPDDFDYKKLLRYNLEKFIPQDKKINPEKIKKPLYPEIYSKSKINNSLDAFLNRLKKRINKKDNEKIRAKTAPQLECLTPEEQAECSVSEYSAADVVDNMIINAYSLLTKGNYEPARTQLSYLRTLDLSRVLDGDKETQERAKRAIKDLRSRLK